jgi:NAD-dependent dihydropyrimidine dehydrogenase PreA subunit
MGVEKQGRGLLRVDGDECKGCGLCVEACPPKVMALNDRLNHYGYRTAAYAGSGCTACGICFLVCPEPGAITVLRRRKGVAVLHPATSGELTTTSERDVEGATGCASN